MPPSDCVSEADTVSSLVTDGGACRAPPSSVCVLILGDGNFSFALSLARQLARSGAAERTPAHAYLRVPARAHVDVLATSFDSRDEVVRKYPEASSILSSLEKLARGSHARLRVRTRHGVNSWDIAATIHADRAEHERVGPAADGREQHGGVGGGGGGGDGGTPAAPGVPAARACTFDRVVWNHPHLGLEDFRLHRYLLAHFFACAASVLAPPRRESAAAADTPGGADGAVVMPAPPGAGAGADADSDAGVDEPLVIVSLVVGQAGRWNLAGNAARAALRTLQCSPFEPADFPGYECRRNKNGKNFKSAQTQAQHGHGMLSEAYVFARERRREAEGGAPAADGRVRAVEGGAAAGAPVPDPPPSSSSSSSLPPPPRPPPSNAAAASSEAAGASHPFLPESSYVHEASIALREAAKPFACGRCHRTFGSERGRRTHERCAHELRCYGADWRPEAERALACAACARTFATARDLRQHEEALHGYQPPPAPPGSAGALPAGVAAVSPSAAAAAAGLPACGCDGAAADAPAGGEGDGGFAGPTELCAVCGQRYPRAWGLAAHLEALKPVVGLRLHCLFCARADGRPCRDFFETRAWAQHMRRCYWRHQPPAAAERGAAAADADARRSAADGGGGGAPPLSGAAE